MEPGSKIDAAPWEVRLVFTETIGSTQDSDEPGLIELLPAGASHFEVKDIHEDRSAIPF